MEQVDLNDPLINKDKHKNKRNMAWFSLLSMVAITFTLMLFFDPSVVDRFENIVATLYVVLGGVVATYMGTATFDSINYQRVKNK